MGLESAFHLHVERPRLVEALSALADLAAPRAPGEAPRTEVVHGDGEVLALPFTSGFKSTAVVLDERAPPVKLDMVLLFDLDHEVMAHFGDRLGEVLVGEAQVRLGYVYGTVHARAPGRAGDAGLSLVELTAATTAMSRLFERSTSIREELSLLLARRGGVCGHLDREDDEGVVFWLDGRRVDLRCPPYSFDLEWLREEAARRRSVH